MADDSPPVSASPTGEGSSPPAGGGSPVDDVTHRIGGAEDEAAIQALFEEIFGMRRSSAEWRWRFLAAPLPTRIHLLERHGRLVGHVALEWFDTYFDGERLEAVSGGDWMYHPDIRGQGVGRWFFDEFLADSTRMPGTVGFPSAGAQTATGTGQVKLPADRGSVTLPSVFEVPQWLRWRTGRAVRASNDRVPRSVGRVLASGAAAAARVGGALARRNRTIEEGWGEPGELDELAERLRTLARCLRARHSAYLDWRWRQHPDRDWWMLTSHDQVGRLMGWLVAGIDPTTPGMGRIVDLLAEDASTTTTLVAAAHRRLGQLGAEVTSCELHDPRRWVTSAMRRAGFVARGGGPMARPPSWAEVEAWRQPGAWYVTRGDTDFA